jgi:hypothetical protein
LGKSYNGVSVRLRILCKCQDYHRNILASLLGTHKLSKDVKECRPRFLAPLLGYKPSDDVKKCQQAFLVPLPGKAKG